MCVCCDGTLDPFNGSAKNAHKSVHFVFNPLRLCPFEDCLPGKERFAVVHGRNVPRFQDSRTDNLNYTKRFEVTVGKTILQYPLTTLLSCFCAPCAACFIRRKAYLLRNETYHWHQKKNSECCYEADPNSLDKCCCVCKVWEKNCCVLLNGIESFCCLPCSIRATRNYVHSNYNLRTDPCDLRIMRCRNVVQLFCCCLYCCAYCVGTSSEWEEDAWWCMDRMTQDTCQCLCAGCLQAQIYVELDKQKKICRGTWPTEVTTQPQSQSLPQQHQVVCTSVDVVSDFNPASRRVAPTAPPYPQQIIPTSPGTSLQEVQRTLALQAQLNNIQRYNTASSTSSEGYPRPVRSFTQWSSDASSPTFAYV
eukprot:m.149541 g.149541  ORF g.149541 m.149541 type:complete len:363 (-) comp15016_c0_seq6:207-1295(-)